MTQPTVLPVRAEFRECTFVSVGDDAVSEAGAAVSDASFARPKSSTFDAVAVCHEQVGGLDVPVDDAAPMGGVERLGNLPREVQDPRGGDRALLDQLFDRAALEQLHCDKRLTAVFAEFVNRTDVRMLRDDASFASRSNRASHSVDVTASVRSSLIATSRPSCRSSARYTTPMPPSPRGFNSR